MTGQREEMNEQGGAELPDVQAGRPEVEVGLTRVGVQDVKKLVKVARNDNERPLVFMARFYVYVDLPAERKGLDMSRNMEVINEVLDDLTRDEVYRVEDLCLEIAQRLLDRHSYTTHTEVQMTAEYMYREETPVSELETQGTALIHASGHAGNTQRKSVGAEVVGTTACPCSQGMMETETREKLKELGIEREKIDEFLEEIPQPAHNQRSRAYIEIETNPEDMVSLDDLIEIARDSMSSRIYNLAKRPDEHHMTQEMHRNARFVEDVVREAAKLVVERLSLPDDAVITIRQQNEESIHQHDAYSETKTTMKNLVQQIDKEA